MFDRYVKRILVLLFCFFSVNSYAQTNVSGYIESDATWTLANSPYVLTGTVTIRKNTTLTIEDGVEVQFNSGYYLYIGDYYSANTAKLIANNVTFRGTGSSSGVVKMHKNGDSSSSITNSIFRNSYLNISENSMTATSCSFDSARYAVYYENGGSADITGISIGNDIQYPGIYYTGNISTNFSLQNYTPSVTHYFGSVSVRKGATLTVPRGSVIKQSSSLSVYEGSNLIIEPETEIDVYSFYIGSSATSTGTMVADSVLFRSFSTYPTLIRFAENSVSTINNSVFDQVAFYYRHATSNLTNCSIDSVDYPIELDGNSNMTVSNLTLGTEVRYPGTRYYGYYKEDYSLTDYGTNWNHYLGMTVRNGSTFTIPANKNVFVNGTVSIEDSSALVFEDGAEVDFTRSTSISIGNGTTSKASVSGNNLNILCSYSYDSFFDFHANSTNNLTNTTFDNVSLRFFNAGGIFTNSTIDNVDYPFSFTGTCNPDLDGVTLGSNIKYPGIKLSGNFDTDFTPTNYTAGYPYYIYSCNVRKGATFTMPANLEIELKGGFAFQDSSSLVMEQGSKLYSVNTYYSINIGSAYGGPAKLIANGAEISTNYTSDGTISFVNGAQGTFNNCVIDGYLVDIDGSHVDFNNSSVDNTEYAFSIDSKGTFSTTNMTWGNNIKYMGFRLMSYFDEDYTLQDFGSGLDMFLYGLYIRNGSNFTIPRGINVNVTGVIEVNTGATLIIEPEVNFHWVRDSRITVGSSYNNGFINVDSVNFTNESNYDSYVYFHRQGTGYIKNSKLMNVCLDFYGSTVDTPIVENSVIAECNRGVRIQSGAYPSITNCDFVVNKVALRNEDATQFNAPNNYWGHSSGPRHSTNPTGIGQVIEGDVNFTPFATAPITGEVDLIPLQNTYSFGTLEVGDYKNDTLYIVNRGSFYGGILDVTADSPSFRIVEDEDIWIAPGDTGMVTLRFAPNTGGTFSGKLYLHTNDKNNPTIDINMSGNGTGIMTASEDTLDFGRVKFKRYVTRELWVKNDSQVSYYVDSLIISGDSYSVSWGNAKKVKKFDDFAKARNSGAIPKKERSNKLSSFYIYAGDSIRIAVTYRPRVFDREDAELRIHYRNFGIENVTLLAEGYADPLDVQITSFNYQAFPFIYMNAVVDTFGFGFDQLVQKDFQVYENGLLQTDYFEVIPPGQGGGTRLTDIIFIMDNSGSMSEEQAAVRDNVSDFVTNLAGSGVNFALGLCRYGASANSGNPIYEDNGNLTSDADYFKNNVWARNQISGGHEPGYRSIEQSATEFNFRPGSQKIFIIITDETPDQDDVTVEDAINTCLSGSITLFALTEKDLYEDFYPITQVTNGQVFDIYSDFSDILDYISTLVSNNYVVKYKTTNSEMDGTLREVVLRANYSVNTASDTVYYNANSIPVITRLDTTIAIEEKPIAQGSPVTISATIVDNIEPYVQSAKVFYKNSKDSIYKSVNMTTSGNDIYTADIPGVDVQEPGLDYYITATDGLQASTSPKTNPAASPYQIAVLPNVAPTLIHTPVEYVAFGNSLEISALMRDSTNNLTETKLFVRKVGQLVYSEVNMTLTSTPDVYNVTIPANEITLDDIEYYLKATDDFGISSYAGRKDKPYRVRIIEAELNATVGPLTGGPQIDTVAIPTNGIGYYYLDFVSSAKNITKNQIFYIDGMQGGKEVNVKAMFLADNVLRVEFANTYSDGEVNLSKDIFYNDTLFHATPENFAIQLKKVSPKYHHSYNVLASRSAGLEGYVGPIKTADVNLEAAKNSIKGNGSVGVTVDVDQNYVTTLDRRFEYAVKDGAQSPPLVFPVGEAYVGVKGEVFAKKLVGQTIRFDNENLNEIDRSTLEATFLLESFSMGGAHLSPIMGPVLKALQMKAATISNVNDIIDSSMVSNYWGLGIEGTINEGYTGSCNGITFRANEITQGFAGIVKVAQDYRERGMMRSVKADTFGYHVDLTQSFAATMSGFDYGLQYNDGVLLNSGNFGLFDNGVSGSFSVIAELDKDKKAKGLKAVITGGGSAAFEEENQYTYYSTVISVPEDYLAGIATGNSYLAGLLGAQKTIPLGTAALPQAVNDIRALYPLITNAPISMQTLEKKESANTYVISSDFDKIFSSNFGISFGVSTVYTSGLTYPKKNTLVFKNGENYLINSANYYDGMNEFSFNAYLNDILNASVPYTGVQFESLIDIEEQEVNLNDSYFVQAITPTGAPLGSVSGIAPMMGTIMVTRFDPATPRIVQNNAFEEPVLRNAYISDKVMVRIKGTDRVKDAGSVMAAFGETMNVSFVASGKNTPEDTLQNAFALKMVVREAALVKAGFVKEDKADVNLFYFDDDYQEWIRVGGSFSNDTLVASVRDLGTYSLGIEIFTDNDQKAPQVVEFGQKADSTISAYPMLYAQVKDNKFGSGVNLAKTYMILEGDTLDFAYNPEDYKIIYQLSEADSLKKQDVNVVVHVEDFAGNKTENEYNITVTGVEEEEMIPMQYALEQNYPNPFNPTTTIKVAVPKKGKVTIKIYDAIGRLIKTLNKSVLNPGYHEFIWNGINNNGFKVSSGVYFYQMKANKFNVVKKMILLK